MNSGVVPVSIESDAAVVVKWINGGEYLCSDIGSIIVDIRNLLSHLCCASVAFVPRKANQVAHFLAKHAFHCVEDMFWLEDFLLGIIHSRTNEHGNTVPNICP